MRIEPYIGHKQPVGSRNGPDFQGRKRRQMHRSANLGQTHVRDVRLGQYAYLGPICPFVSS